jgi:hypothetical protein
MARKPKTSSTVEVATLRLQKEDPSLRFPLDHSVPTLMYDTEDVPKEFKGASAPSIGPGTLCQVKSGRSVGELELVRPFISSGAVKLCFQLPERKGGTGCLDGIETGGKSQSQRAIVSRFQGSSQFTRPGVICVGRIKLL